MFIGRVVVCEMRLAAAGVRTQQEGQAALSASSTRERYATITAC